LVAVFLLLRIAHPLTWLRGLSIPFLIGGLIFGIGGAINGRITQKVQPGKVQLYKQDRQAFFKEEVPKVERTHRSWFGIRLFWSLMAVAGLALLFSVKKDFWMGVGLGTILISLMGHVEEAISMKRNESYYRQVLESAKQATVPPINLPIDCGKDSVKENKPALDKSYRDHRQVIKKVKEPAAREQIVYVDTIHSEPPLTYDILLPLAELVFSKQAKQEPNVDTLNEDKSYTLISNDTIAQVNSFPDPKVALPYRKKKVMDYYRSEMNVTKEGTVRRCWKARKYIHE
jgi:hypothetical protein